MILSLSMLSTAGTNHVPALVLPCLACSGSVRFHILPHRPVVLHENSTLVIVLSQHPLLQCFVLLPSALISSPLSCAPVPSSVLPFHVFSSPSCCAAVPRRTRSYLSVLWFCTPISCSPPCCVWLQSQGRDYRVYLCCCSIPISCLTALLCCAAVPGDLSIVFICAILYICSPPCCAAVPRTRR